MIEQNKILIITPAYNESENIPILFENIFSVLEKNEIKGEIIVVDDNSQDGTDKVVRNYTKEYAVKLITRKNEKGLASACIKGFDSSKGDAIIVMDADLQHPVSSIPDFLDCCLRRNDGPYHHKLSA